MSSYPWRHQECEDLDIWQDTSVFRQIHQHAEEVRQNSADALWLYMTDAFCFRSFEKQHPDMSAEEIASAAADGFEIEG